MKNSKRLLRILNQAQQSASPITCSAFLRSYLKEEGIIQKAVNHYLLQTNSLATLTDSLDELDRGARATLYNRYLLTDYLYKAIEFGSARAEKFNQIVMTEAHVLEGVLSSLRYRNLAVYPAPREYTARLACHVAYTKDADESRHGCKSCFLTSRKRDS